MGVSIKDVAKRAGVSIGTVSKYVNGINIKDKNKQSIQEAIDYYGFKVNAAARNLKTNKTMTVGVILTQLRFHFCSTLIPFLHSKFFENGYSTIFFDLSDDVEKQVEQVNFICNHGLDGLIIMEIESDTRLMELISSINMPKIVIENKSYNTISDVVLVDNLNASYKAVEHFIIHKHRKIAIICGPELSYSAVERVKGYLRVFDDYRIEVDERYILYGKYEIDSGYKNMKALLEMEDRPTAVLATNYEITIGSLKAINELGLSIPDDISFIGFDNQDVAEVIKPGITIVTQPIKQLAEQSALLLIKRMQGDYDSFPALERLKTEFRPLNSVKDIN